MSLLGDVIGGAISLAKSVFGGGSNSSERDYGGGSSYSSSSSSSTVTNLDPDKVKVAELENKRVMLVKEAQAELIELNARMEAAMIEARCRGFHAMQSAMMTMLKEVNTLAEERLVLLENGSFEQIKKVETMYADLAKDIKDDDFLSTKLPELLNMANQFQEGSTNHTIFSESIRQEVTVQINFKQEQLKGLRERCKTVTDSVIASKERMQAHIDTVITQRIEHLEQVVQNNTKLEFKGTNLQLDAPKSSNDGVAKVEHQVQ